MLALIVPGRRQVNNMDVYLLPLVDELNELWDGINVYDVSRPIAVERSFTLYGICTYMTHDYPGLNISLVNYIFIDFFIYVTIFFHILVI